MILRNHRTQAIRLATLRELASMAHEAEETDDDLTALGIMEELEARDRIAGVATEIFRQLYIEQWPSRYAVRVRDEVSDAR